MGWYYLPVVLLCSTMVLVSATMVNNVQRRYPVFWWKPVTPTRAIADTPNNERNTVTDHIPITAGAVVTNASPASEL
jgi:CBS-domain-containing membrane protein